MSSGVQTTVERYQESVQLAESGRPDLAIANFRRVLQAPRIEPSLRARVLSDIAVILYADGQIGSALDHLLDALRHDPTSEDARQNLAALIAEPAVLQAAELGLQAARHEHAERLPEPNTAFVAAVPWAPTVRGRGWPGWDHLIERTRIPAARVGADGGVPSKGPLDARGLLGSLPLITLLSESRAIVTADAGVGALGSLLGVPTLVLTARGLEVEGKVRGETEDDLARIPVERVLEALESFAPDTVAPAPCQHPDPALAPYFEGRGVELSHGGKKLLPRAVGIDAIRCHDHDRIGNVTERLLVPDESFRFVIGRAPLPASLSAEDLLDRWLRPLEVGGHLIVLADTAPDRLPLDAIAEACGDSDVAEVIDTTIGSIVLRKLTSDRRTLAENVALNEAELAERRDVLESGPTYMEVSSTIVCNINTPPCVQCWKHADPSLGYLKGDQAHLKSKHFDRVAPFLGGANLLSLHGIGEPLANPRLFEYIEYADREADCWFVSNGLLLNDARIDKILGSKLARIDFSLDAATPETYRKIRHHDFDDVIAKIKRLVEERDRRGLQTPRAYINMTLMRENVHELPDFVRLAKEIGADHVHAFHMNQGVSYRVGWFDYEEQHCENDPEAHDRAVEEAFRVAEELGVAFEMTGKRRLAPEPPDADRSDAGGGDQPTLYIGTELDSDEFFCPKPWTSALIDQNGNVLNCCWQARGLGNLEQSSFEEIWNGPLAQAIRRSTAEGKPHPACSDSKNVCPWLGRT